LALVCWTLVMVTAIASLPASRALRTLVVACALGRTAALAHASLLTPARPDGLGAAFAPGLATVILASAGTAAAAVLLSGLSNAALAVAATAVTTVIVTVASRRFFGGRTGDTLGTTVAVTEAVVCLTLLAGWR
jgi:adenosylcobinamide-GDP ribazoletransferase